MKLLTILRPKSLQIKGMFILRTTILLILLIFSIHNQASAIQIKKGLQDIKIVSADKLNYKSDVSILEGNVIIKVKDI